MTATTARPGSSSGPPAQRVVGVGRALVAGLLVLGVAGLLRPSAAADGAVLRQTGTATADDAVARARAGAGVLADGSGPLAIEDQVRWHELALELVDRGELEPAAELQVALHGRVRQEWSAINAALSLGNLGRAADADRLLADQLERTPRAGELWNRRGLLALGAGDLRVAHRHLGRARRYGSVNAGLSLARLSLLGGAQEAARAGFRPGVGGSEPHAWALRGWARTLLAP